MAADEGFEPSHTESESAVLPLHKSAKAYFVFARGIIPHKFGFVNSFFEFFSEILNFFMILI